MKKQFITLEEEKKIEAIMKKAITKAPNVEIGILVSILHQAFLGFQLVDEELIQIFTTDPCDPNDFLDYDYRYSVFSAMYRGFYDSSLAVISYWNEYSSLDRYVVSVKKELTECVEVTIAMMKNANKALAQFQDIYVVFDEEIDLLKAFRYFESQLEYIETIYRLI